MSFDKAMRIANLFGSPPYKGGFSQLETHLTFLAKKTTKFRTVKSNYTAVPVKYREDTNTPIIYLCLYETQPRKYKVMWVSSEDGGDSWKSKGLRENSLFHLEYKGIGHLNREHPFFSKPQREKIFNLLKSLEVQINLNSTS